MKELYFNTVQEFNDFYGFETLHPQLSVARFDREHEITEGVYHYGFYALFLKENKGCKLSYGLTDYDFDEMTMTSFAPGQSVRVEANPEVKYPNGLPWCFIRTCSSAPHPAGIWAATSFLNMPPTRPCTFPRER